MKRFIYIILLLASLCLPIIAGGKPYVILVSFDGFRWDYLNKGLTPNLEYVAQNGVKALSLRPTFPSKTFPNHYAIITGMYNDHHGIISNYFENPLNGQIYKLSDREAVQDESWYDGEAFWETAKKQGINTASFYWPGSELTNEKRRPHIYKEYNHYKPYNERIDSVISWLQMPYISRPHFITLYFHETDDAGHKFGPDSKEVNISISKVDRLAGKIIQGLEDIGMKDSVNIIFLSDHGMTNVYPDKIIRVDKILQNYDVKFSNQGPFVFIDNLNEPENEIFNRLKSEESNYKVFRKNEIPDYLHFKNHAFIPPIILIADLGYSLETRAPKKNMNFSKGNHGYINSHLDMHGFFVAMGPNFKVGFNTGTIWNIDINPLLARIFNIFPNPNIDGKLERIEFLLK